MPACALVCVFVLPLRVTQKLRSELPTLLLFLWRLVGDELVSPALSGIDSNTSAELFFSISVARRAAAAVGGGVGCNVHKDVLCHPACVELPII